MLRQVVVQFLLWLVESIDPIGPELKKYHGAREELEAQLIIEQEGIAKAKAALAQLSTERSEIELVIAENEELLQTLKEEVKIIDETKPGPTTAGLSNAAVLRDRL